MLSSYTRSDDIIVVDFGWNIPSTFSQETVEQLEVIQKVVLSEVSKLTDLVIKKTKVDPYSFLQKKTLEREK